MEDLSHLRRCWAPAGWIRHQKRTKETQARSLCTQDGRIGRPERIGGMMHLKDVIWKGENLLNFFTEPFEPILCAWCNTECDPDHVFGIGPTNVFCSDECYDEHSERWG